jgi:hypothetical protein
VGCSDRAPWESATERGEIDALRQVCDSHLKLGVMFVVIKGQGNRGLLGCYTVSTVKQLTVLTNDHSAFSLRVGQSWVRSKVTLYQSTRRNNREGLNL